MRKESLKRIVCTVAVLVACSVSLPANADVKNLIEGEVDQHSVYAVEKEDQRYLVTELVEKKRVKISKWNLLRFKRGELYRQYRLHEGKGLVRFDNRFYKSHKNELKDVPDNRPYENRCEWRYNSQEFFRRWTPVITGIAGPAIAAVIGSRN